MTNLYLRTLVQQANAANKRVYVSFNTLVIGISTVKKTNFALKTGRNPFHDLKPPFGSLRKPGSMMVNSEGSILVVSGKPDKHEGLVLVKLRTPLRPDIEIVAVPIEAVRLVEEQKT